MLIYILQVYLKFYLLDKPIGLNVKNRTQQQVGNLSLSLEDSCGLSQVNRVGNAHSDVRQKFIY